MSDFEKAMAICQHHDAITGTSIKRVVKDYESMLLNTREKLNLVINGMLKDFMKSQL